ncbi:MAG: glycosyltransferase [Gemmatimonadota bacterium]|nr:glycosyltransferase [Gemmatimonadota bacterium]
MPTFNRRDQVIECVRKAHTATRYYGNAKLVVVDNGSTDGTWEWLQAEIGTDATLLRHANRSISSLRNAGAASEPSDYVSFVDSDCLVPADYVTKAVDVLREVDATMVGSMYVLPPDVHWVEETWMRLNCPPRDGDASLLPGGNMMLRRHAFDAVGGFNESLITGEDAELCSRIIQHGGRIFETRRVSLIHLRNMNSLTGFFKKQVWHSLGMLGARQRDRLDRVTLMSLAHLALSLVALGWIAVGPGAPSVRALGSGVLILIVPTVAVAYRVLLRGGAFIPLKSLLLYTIYFYARIWGLFRIVFTRATVPRGVETQAHRSEVR